jgi:hypothetical protein
VILASNEFPIYLQIGARHILDPKGIDHILFVAALTAVHRASEWRRVVWLVTAFTLGHSLTLALATLNVVHVSTAWVEFLIPLTIFVTSGLNILNHRMTADANEAGVAASAKRLWPKYAMACGFGLIHGLGFSNALRSMLGAEESIVMPLFAFNVGLELGQLLIVAVGMLTAAAVVYVAKLPWREWVLVLSGATGGVAVTMMLTRLP